MGNKSISKNAILNMIKTVSAIIFPLITFPYITRILTVEDIGKYNFSASIISYFALIASLGISTYAIREGAQYRSDRSKISSFASEIYSLNVISTIFAYVLLIITVCIVPKLQNYTVLIAILSLELMFTTWGASWIFNIFEEFGFITLVTCLFQVVSLILMFGIVKKDGDLTKYVAIVAFANIGGNIFYRAKARKFCDLHFTIKVDINKHIKPVLLLFSTAIAATIYVSSDTTLLGFLSSDYYVGLYSVSAKIYKIVKQLFLAIVIVTVPRAALLFRTAQNDKAKELLSNILDTLVFLGVPATAGLIGISKYVILIIAGEEYLEANTSLILLAAALLFALLASFFSNCVLIPNRRDKTVLNITVISAVINMGLNFMLIPKYHDGAAAFTTLIAEVFTTIAYVQISNKIVRITVNKKNLVSSLLGAISIYITCYWLQKNIDNWVTGTIACIICSVVVYAFVQLIFRNPLLFEAITQIKKKIGKK